MADEDGKKKKKKKSFDEVFRKHTTPRERVKRAEKKIGEKIQRFIKTGKKGEKLMNFQRVSDSTLQTAANSGDPGISTLAKKEIKRRQAAGTFGEPKRKKK